MDLTLSLGSLLRFAAANLWLTITCVLVLIIHSWVMMASLRSIAQMVRELHDR